MRLIFFSWGVKIYQLVVLLTKFKFVSEIFFSRVYDKQQYQAA